MCDAASGSGAARFGGITVAVAEKEICKITVRLRLCELVLPPEEGLVGRLVKPETIIQLAVFESPRRKSRCGSTKEIPVRFGAACLLSVTAFEKNTAAEIETKQMPDI